MPEVRRIVLIVDDEEAVRAMLVMAIRTFRPDLEPLEADDVPPAIQLLESQPVECIVTDLEMPSGHGNDIIRAARQRNPQTPIIAITGNIKQLREPTEGFLAKPFNLDELRALLEELLPSGVPQVA